MAEAMKDGIYSIDSSSLMLGAVRTHRRTFRNFGVGSMS